ncbi:RNA-directed DNA polymerase, eukaryota [Tanacetum coccineum]
MPEALVPRRRTDRKQSMGDMRRIDLIIELLRREEEEEEEMWFEEDGNTFWITKAEQDSVYASPYALPVMLDHSYVSPFDELVRVSSDRQPTALQRLLSASKFWRFESRIILMDNTSISSFSPKSEEWFYQEDIACTCQVYVVFLLWFFGVLIFFMIRISLNCNGLGCILKRDWIKDLVSKNRPSFVGIQETKIDSISQALIRYLCPDGNVAFASSGSVGASGGILTLWDTNTFSLKSEIVGRNFVVVVGTWAGMQGKVGIMNVYAPQDRHLKEALWSSIESILGSVNITWIVFGDFNVVRSQEDRSGCRFNPGEANIFNDFIYRCRLFDFLLGGRKFTRFDRDGAKASKLDRFLVNQEFFEQ